MGLWDRHARFRQRHHLRAGRGIFVAGMTITVTLAIVIWTLLALNSLAGPDVLDPIAQPQATNAGDPGSAGTSAAELHVVTSLPSGQTHPTPVVGQTRIIYLNYNGPDDPVVSTPTDNAHSWLDHDDVAGSGIDTGRATHHHHDSSDVGT